MNRYRQKLDRDELVWAAILALTFLAVMILGD